MAEKYISQFTGQEIDERLQAVAEKYGHIEMRFDEQQSMYYMDCYANKDDVTEGKEPLESVLIPISTKQGTSYAAFLTGNIGNTVDLVVAEKKLEIELNYRAIQITEAGNINANAAGTLVVQRQTSTTSWQTVGEIADVLPSNEPTDTTTTTKVNVGQFVASGKQNLRVQAVYKITDDETGEEKTIRSGYVMVGQSVNLVELRLELTTPYHVPMNAYNEETGALETFKVDYRVYGAVSKILYIKVKGAKGANTVASSLSATEDGTTKGIALDENVAYEYMTHGIREVTAWLECQDGLGGTIQSEAVINQFMMVNPQSVNYDATKKYLLLQNVESSITNFIQSKIANYSIYSPDGSDTEVIFKLTDALENSYTEVIKTVAANTPTDLLISAQIEPSDEGSIQDEYKTRFYAYKGDENFIQSSGHSYDDPSKLRSYYDVTVDNKEAVYPVLGATFLLNPKNRDNSEENPKVIYNEKANNAIVEAEFENFGLLHDLWVTDESGNKVLRVMAGEKLTIKRNIWKQFKTNPNSSLTIDIDYKISNVTNLADPVVSILGGTDKGIMLNALTGWVKTASYNETDNCNFNWREDKKQYLSVNIHNEVYPKKVGVEDVKYTSSQASLATGSLAIARVLLNGDPVREVPFDTSNASEWCDDDDAAIIIGNEGADIDIYSIRIYENRQVDWVDLLNRNYISSLFTTEEKQRQRIKNDLLAGGIISLEKAKQAGLNCIVYHGKRPFYYESGNGTGWIEYHRYDMDGNALPEFSGTNCKASAALAWKGQGSTAMLYDEFNQQDDNSKVEATVEIPVEQFHESIHVSEPYEVNVEDEEGNVTGTKQVVDIYGGNLGKNFPLTNDTQTYDYSDGKVLVTDGWIDGNGMYRGAGYRVSEGTSLAQKKVAKINYASAMQSHLPAACKSYDELHYECVGASPLQAQYIALGLTRPVSAKHIEPFLMFFNETGKMVNGEWVEDESKTYFTGLCTYGAGKMDKITWGYVKKKHPMFAMIEGSDNNLPLTDFRVPWDDKVTYSTSEEGFIYNGYTSWDFDAGKTDDDDIPDATLVKQLRRFHNFVYLNSTNIKYYVGTMAQFKALPESSVDIESKYWCTDGEDAFRLLRYDYTQPEGLRWVDAGLNESIVDLSTDSRTKATYETYKSSTAYDEMNEAFKADFAKFMKTYGNYLIKLRSLLFNYVYVLMFLAGTDNSSKNTYYKLDPIAQKVSRNDEFAAWWLENFGEEFDFDNVYLIFLDGDDMDSILPVNNKGNLTKPYYIERLYPYADGSTDNLYEGTKNQLFNFVEIGYSVQERSEMMNLILQKLQDSVKESDKLLGLADNRVSAWGGLHKYFFNIQYYFPQICYIEQARIRYEFAQLIGHSGARGVKPLSQSIGSQLENEQQFMEQRLVYMASFGAFGELGDTKSGSVGLTDSGTQLQFQAAPLPDGSAATIEMTVTPHQYIYPCGFDGQTTKPTYQRTSPQQTCKVSIASNVTSVSDTTMGLRGANYYSDYGNLGTLSTTSAFTVTGKRLKTFRADGGNFRPSSIIFSATMITSYFRGNSTIAINVDLSTLNRLEAFSETTSLGNTSFPKTHTLKSITATIGGGVNRFELESVPNLETLTFSTGYQTASALKTFIVGENVGTNTTLSLQSNLDFIYNNNADLTTLKVLNNFTWTNLSTNVMDWMLGIENLDLKGKISIASTSTTDYLSYDSVVKMIDRFGNVQSEANRLYVDYPKRSITDFSIKGEKYIRKTGAWNGWSLSVLPTIGNNIKVVDGREGVEWEFEEAGYTAYGTWTDAVKGLMSVTNLARGALFTLKVTLTLFDGSTLAKTRKIGFWDREPEVGDFAFVDGGFDNEYDESKTLAGVVVKKDDIAGSTSKKVWVYAKENATCTSTDGTSMNTASFRWGLWFDADGIDSSGSVQGFPDSLCAEIEATEGVNASVDDLSLTNVGNTGLTTINSGGTRVGYSYLTDRESYGDSQYLDDTQIDGYRKEFPSQGGYFTENNAAVLHFTEGEGDVVTDVAKKVVGVYLEKELPVTRTELADALLAIRAEHAGETSPTRYDQFYFPAQYACHLYEPASNKAGEVIHDAYKRGKWNLPSVGLLIRVYNFWYNSLSLGEKDSDGKYIRRVSCQKQVNGSWVNSGSSVKAEYADETAVEALLPLFANVLKRLADKGATSVFTIPSASSYWSSSEYDKTNAWGVNFTDGYCNGFRQYNSYVARGVAAFTFTPVE